MTEEEIRAIVRDEIARAVKDIMSNAGGQAAGDANLIVDWMGSLVDFDTLSKTVDKLIDGMDKRIIAQIRAYDANLPARIAQMMNKPQRR